ncbi:expressed unknown protein [Seminavis robusta]|uniref:Uncharacterized protein n=1 Tax=Seminavis robusta TaxID=568900 RepID=A0A9N8HTS0_9STRA|nr:expressed unknown protein [Seminavis robusta]|eukprot:Sro1307_g261360.1 n/a (156) ;mRNA; f:21961-22428
MEATFTKVGGIEDFDSRSVSSLTTVPISNKSNITSDVSSRFSGEVLENPDETDTSTSNVDELDEDLLDADLQEKLREASRQAARQAARQAREARQAAKRKQRKRNWERFLQNGHEDAKKDNKKHCDDENGDEGGNSDSKRPAVAAAPASVGVASK